MIREFFIDKQDKKDNLTEVYNREVIEEYASYNGQKLSLYYNFPFYEYNLDMIHFYIHSIYGVYINYPLQKKDISVEIVKLL